MKNLFIVSCVICFGAGCATIPFEPVNLVPLGDVSAEEVLSRARSALPEQFTVLNSIVFKIHGHSMSALGYTAVDQTQNSFSVLALNPMGIKLFEFSDSDGRVTTNYIMEGVAKQGNVAEAVARDIRRIYFDRVPPATAESQKNEYTFVFTEKKENGTVRYVFGGTDIVLIEKQFYDTTNDKLWSVSYHEYQLHEGRLYPAGMIFRHYKHNYRLIVRLRELKAEEVSGYGVSEYRSKKTEDI